MKTKIAALILAHDRPDCLAELLSRISGPLWHPCVHIDAKSDMKQFEHLHTRAQFLASRHAVYWGHISQVDTTIALMRTVLEDETLTHLALLSGRCLPLRSDDKIAMGLSSAIHGGNFIDQRVMPNELHKIQRISKPHFRHIQNRTLRKVHYHLRKWRMPPEAHRLQAEMKFASGSQWWILSKEAALQIVRFLDEEAWYRTAFEYSLCADEFFFHTAFQHLGMTADGPSQTYARFPNGADSPVTLDKKEWEKARASGKLFARKSDVFFP